jgi:hypothetical protein
MRGMTNYSLVAGTRSSQTARRMVPPHAPASAIQIMGHYVVVVSETQKLSDLPTFQHGKTS